AAGADLDLAVEDRQPGVLLHLVLAELLARAEDDQDRARAVVGVQDQRITGAVRRVHGEEIPRLHAVIGPEATLKRLPMPLVVDPFVLGPFRSNCYVLRSERGAPEAAVSHPGDDPT